MDSKELRLFRESYASIRKPQTENIQEGEYDDARRAERSATEAQRRAQDEARRRRMRNQPGGFAAGDPEDKVKAESSDLFDIVKGYLISEGYADTEEAALAIMTNMSEEWKQSILEADQPVGKAKLNPDGSGTQKTTGGNTIHYDRHVDYRSKEVGKKGTRTSVPFSGTEGCPPSGCAF